MDKSHEEILCVLCKERISTQRLQITTENGISLVLLLCENCAQECDS